MLQLLEMSAFAPFIIAGMVLLILLAVEMFSFVFGGISGFLDNLLPDSLVGTDVDTDVGVYGDMSLGLKALDWLYVGRIPTMILLILFIASFCVTGFMIQQLAFAVLGTFISPWLASLDALVISFPILKILASILYPILPKDESSAISGDSFVGRQVRIVLGCASMGSPAQAKLTDEHGQTHYMMVEPDPAYESSLLRHAATLTSATLISIDNKDSANKDSDNKDMNSNNRNTIITAEDTLIITQKIGERYLVKKL